MLNSVIRSSILDEFTNEEQEYWFSINEKAVSHHIDSLYYSVFIKHDGASKDDNITLSRDKFYDNLGNLLLDLYSEVQRAVENPDIEFKFHDLVVCKKGVSVAGGLYGYHLACGSNGESDYDIFFSKYLPNDQTPRIHVQLRTRSLILDGLYGAIDKSFEKVLEILSAYGLQAERVQENRIDYAFHTNVIQRPAVVFSDQYLSRHLETSFRESMKHSWITGKAYGFFDLDYFALGSRKSNNVFFRAYDKTKEVVQQNYKPFFIRMWLERGLISRYDEYVYKIAYKMRSFKTGCLVGRIEWYLEHGKDAELKSELRDLLQKCNIKSDNNPFMEKKINGLLPPTTVVMNMEFETKRKYYLASHKFFHEEPDDVKLFVERNYKGRFPSSPYREALKPLYEVLRFRREIVEDLTNNRVNFVKDKDADSLNLKCDFWERISRVRIQDQPDNSELQLYRTYDTDIQGELASRNLMKNIASCAIYKNRSVEDASFGEDMWDALTSLNDNDLKDQSGTYKALFEQLNIKGYADVRRKKARQLKHIIKRNEEIQKKKDERYALVHGNEELPVKVVLKHDYATCTECGSRLPIEAMVIYYGEIAGKKKGLCEHCSLELRMNKKLNVIRSGNKNVESNN